MESLSFVLGLLQLFTILYICIFEYKNNFTSVFIWGTLLIVFGLPHFITGLTGHKYFSVEVINKASMFVILFNLIYLIIKYVLSISTNKKFNYGFEHNFFNFKNTLNRSNRLTKNNKKLANICLILLVSMFLITFNMMGGFKGASWGKYFSFYSKGYSNLMLYFVYIFYAISGVTLVYIKNGYFVKALVAAVIILATAIITNTKMMIVPLFLLFLSPIVFNENNKFSLKKVIIGIISLISVIYIINFFYVLRAYGSIGRLFDNLTISQLNAKIYDMIYNSEGELGVRNAFYLFIEKNNNFANFNKGHTYIRLLMMFVPTRFSFNMKPVDFAVSMGSAYLGNPNNTTFSMHPTFYGDCFANFGWAGIFLAVFWALATYAIDKIIHNNSDMIRDMLMVSVCTCYVMIGRGSIYNSCVVIIISILIVIILNFLSRLKIFYKNK